MKKPVRHFFIEDTPTEHLCGNPNIVLEEKNPDRAACCRKTKKYVTCKTCIKLLKVKKK
jgi:hypothetical protein